MYYKLWSVASSSYIKLTLIMRLTVSVHALSQPLDGADLFIKLKHQKCSKTQAISN